MESKITVADGRVKFVFVNKGMASVTIDGVAHQVENYRVNVIPYYFKKRMGDEWLYTSSKPRDTSLRVEGESATLSFVNGKGEVLSGPVTLNEEDRKALVSWIEEFYPR